MGKRNPQRRWLPDTRSERFVLIFSLFVISSVILLNLESIKMSITGWAPFSDMGVSIEPVTKGIITEFLLKAGILPLGEEQTVFVEFLNIGSSTLDMKIEHHYYVYNESRLDIVASYYDNRVFLPAGSKRRFNTTFVAPEAGLYYVRVRIPYNTKVTQTWASFLVYTTAPPATVVPPPVVGPPAPAPAGVASASVTWPDGVTVVQGEYKTFEVSIKNIGESELNNLKFYASLPNSLNISFNPKTIKYLRLNSSTLFLVTVGAPSDVEEGTYLLELEFRTDEVKYSKDIDVVVASSNITDFSYLQDLILNYEYLIHKIDSEIYEAFIEGYDVSVANESLNNARSHLDLAKSHLEEQRYGETKEELKTVIRYLQDALFQLASARLYVYRPPAASPIYVFLLEALLALLIFLFIYMRRRRKRKPKALRKGAEA